MFDFPRLAGTRIGDFEVLDEIGRGGMGVVYSARQISLNRKVALKILASELGLGSKAIERFQREAEAAAKLHHTNIVPIYATGQNDGVYYYAMELIEGDSLDRVLHQLRRERQEKTPSPKQAEPLEDALTVSQNSIPSPLPSQEANSSTLTSGSSYFDRVAIMIAEVAEALDHAHACGVIHRDIKPANLLLRKDSRLCVNDFGLARMLERPGVTVTGEFVGTPAYMSPEQITAGRIPLDHRTDIYSLGATLYELLTLERPFRGESRDQVLAQIIQKEPTPPRQIDKKVPIDLETICLKALEKDPDRRYQNGNAMAEDLRRYVQRFAILARRAGLVERTGKWVRRHPTLTAVGVLAVLALVAAGGFAWHSHRLQKEILAERRQNVIEKAILKSMSGEVQAAEDAIAEAERLGIDLALSHTLRGQLELNKGDHPKAIRHLKQAIQLAPTSVSAHASLAYAGWTDADLPEVEAMTAMREAMRLPPKSVEDYLFLAQACAYEERPTALKAIEKVFERRPPPALAYMIRADIRVSTAVDTGNLAMAQNAVEDADMAKRLLPDYPGPFANSVTARMYLAILLKDAGRQQEAAAVEEAALADVEIVEKFPTKSNAAASRLDYISARGELELSREFLARTPKLATEYGQILYRVGEIEAALEVLGSKKGDISADIIRCFVLTEALNGPAKARALFEDLMKQRPRGWNRFNLQLLPRLLGDKENARKISQAMLDDPELLFPAPLERLRAPLRYCAGIIDPEQAVKEANGSNWILVNVHCAIGVTLLGEGKREEARRHFEAAQRTRCHWIWPYWFSADMLARMKSDPRWPHWIK